MTRLIKPTLTPRRRAWLEVLRDHGPQSRSRGRTGADCMALGWTEWNWVKRVTREPVHSVGFLIGSSWWEAHDIDGERITEAGLKMLEVD